MPAHGDPGGEAATNRFEGARPLIGIIALVAVVVAGVALVLTTPRAGTVEPPPQTARPPASQPPALPPPPPTASYRDFVFETAVITAPTATKTQSKLWYADGAWWGALFQPFTNQVNVFRLDWETQLWRDTGTLIDERSTADPDVLWTGEKLYVLSAGPHQHRRDAARVLRFSYDGEASRYALDPNFPVQITPEGVEASVLTQAADGTLWVTYEAEGQIWTVHSLEHDAHWSEPVPLPHDGARVAEEDISSIASYGPGYVGVLWSNQLEGRLYFTYRRDGDPDDAWSDPEVVLEGANYADDHVNLKTYPDGEGTGLVAVLKTSLDQREPVNALDPQIMLGMRPPDGPWATYMVSQVRDRQTRAVAYVDEDERMVYVAATSREGTITYKRASLDSLVFETGPGDPLIVSELDPRIGNASTTKQTVTRESGMVVIASDNRTGRYLHGVLDLGAGLPPVAPDPTDRPELPDPPDPQSPIPLVYADFEPWEPGPPTGTGWATREGDPPRSLRIASDATGGRSLRLRPAPNGAPVRACRDFADRPETILSIDLRVRLAGALGASDTVVLSLRGSGGEAATVRVSSRGDLAWYDGLTKARADITVEPGTVYRIRGTVDQRAKTFSFTINAGGEQVIARRDVGWRMVEVPSVKSICLETTSGAPDQVLELLDIEVLEEPPA